MTSKKKIFFSLIILIISFISIEFFLFLVFKSSFFKNYLSSLSSFSQTYSSIVWREESRYVRCINNHLNPNPITGWVVKPNLEDKDWGTNDVGWRTPKNIASINHEKRKLVFIGDSYTFGLEVSKDEVFTNKLQELRPYDEIINLGVPGFAHDQMYLHLKKYIKKNQTPYGSSYIYRDGFRPKYDVIFFYA